MICKCVLYILYSRKMCNKNNTHIYIFVGELVVRYLPVHHCSKPTSSQRKCVIHAALSLLNKPSLSAYHMADTRDETIRKMRSMFSKSSQSSMRPIGNRPTAQNREEQKHKQPKCCGAARMMKPVLAVPGDSIARS